MCGYGDEQQDAINTVMQEYRNFPNIQELSKNSKRQTGCHEATPTLRTNKQQAPTICASLR